MPFAGIGPWVSRQDMMRHTPRELVSDLDEAFGRLLLKLWPPKVTIERASVVVGLVAVLGIAHRLGDAQISLATFFVVPCALAAWTLGFTPGLLIALLSATVTLASDLATQPNAQPAAIAINSALRFGLYAVVAWGAHMIGELLGHLYELSETDTLTGLTNLCEFRERGSEEIRRANRTQRAFTLVVLDLDDFKAVNDTQGHAAGDAVLKRVGAVMKSSLRDIDTPARIGGDEFAILLPETDADGARAAMLTLRTALKAEFARMKHPLTASIGAATFAQPPETFAEAVKQADELMYTVKNAAKDSVAQRTFPAP